MNNINFENIQGEYVKFYGTTNKSLPVLLSNTGNIIIVQDENRYYTYLGDILLSSGVGFTDVKELNDYKSYVTTVNDNIIDINNKINDIGGLQDKISYNGNISNTYVALSYIDNNTIKEINIPTLELFSNLVVPEYKAPELVEEINCIKYSNTSIDPTNTDDSYLDNNYIRTVYSYNNEFINVPYNSYIIYVEKKLKFKNNDESITQYSFILNQNEKNVMTAPGEKSNNDYTSISYGVACNVKCNKLEFDLITSSYALSSGTKKEKMNKLLSYINVNENKIYELPFVSYYNYKHSSNITTSNIKIKACDFILTHVSKYTISNTTVDDDFLAKSTKEVILDEISQTIITSIKNITLTGNDRYIYVVIPNNYKVSNIYILINNKLVNCTNLFYCQMGTLYGKQCNLYKLIIDSDNYDNYITNANNITYIKYEIIKIKDDLNNIYNDSNVINYYSSTGYIQSDEYKSVNWMSPLNSSIKYLSDMYDILDITLYYNYKIDKNTFINEYFNNKKISSLDGLITCNSANQLIYPTNLLKNSVITAGVTNNDTNYNVYLYSSFINVFNDEKFIVNGINYTYIDFGELMDVKIYNNPNIIFIGQTDIPLENNKIKISDYDIDNNINNINIENTSLLNYYFVISNKIYSDMIIKINNNVNINNDLIIKIPYNYKITEIQLKSSNDTNNIIIDDENINSYMYYNGRETLNELLNILDIYIFKPTTMDQKITQIKIEKI